MTLLRLLHPGIRPTCIFLLASLLGACGSSPDHVPVQLGNPAGPSQLVARQVAQQMPPRLLMTADIGECDHDRRPLAAVQATAALVEERPGLVLVAGDIAYQDGRAVDFSECYDPAWGGVRARTLPAPGNHEYHAEQAAPYFSYFGAQAGAPGQGWYSVDFAGWHIIALNSNLAADPQSVQYQWLQADLQARPKGCLLAFWHHPRFSSGGHGNNMQMDPVWRLLANAGADLVLNGHDHDYERFSPQDAEGRASPHGTREMVVGVGGAALTSFLLIKENSEVRDDATHGILELGLRPDGYDWRFLGTEGSAFEDRGSAQCHASGPP